MFTLQLWRNDGWRGREWRTAADPQPGSKSHLWEPFPNREALLSDGYGNIIAVQFTDWPQVS